MQAMQVFIPRPRERQFTVRQAAKYFGRATRTIRLWCANGTFLAANGRVELQKCRHWRIYLPEQ